MSGGKKNAFRRLGEAGEFVEELGLICFDDHQVIGVLFFHQMEGG
jgi:predicted N-acetyltransferase YhbS